MEVAGRLEAQGFLFPGARSIYCKKITNIMEVNLFLLKSADTQKQYKDVGLKFGGGGECIQVY